MNTTPLTIQESSLKSFLRKLWRPVEQRLGLEGSILLMLVLAAAGVLTAGYLLTRLFRK